MLSRGMDTMLFMPVMKSAVSSGGTSHLKASSRKACSVFAVWIEGPMTILFSPSPTIP